MERCRSLWTCDSKLTPVTEFPSDEQIKEGLECREALNKEALESYHSLVGKICDRLQSGKLLWRHYNMGVSSFIIFNEACAIPRLEFHLQMMMLALLTRYDVPHPAKVSRILLTNLIHEYIPVRKNALSLVGNILKQQKRKHPKIEIHPVEGDGDKKCKDIKFTFH